MVENLSKFLKTNKFGTKVAASNKNVAQNARRNQKQTEAYYIQLETVDAHAPGHVRTNVRREHQAPTHARSSEESTERTVHIQQWGSHPLSLAGWQGPAKLFAN
jgi:hypothetical protein